MTIVAFIFQIVGMLTCVFLLAVGVGVGLRIGLGRPARSPTELERRKDLGVPF